MKKLTLILSVVILTILLVACSTPEAVLTEEIQHTEQPAASLDVSSAEAVGPPSPPTCIPIPPVLLPVRRTWLSFQLIQKPIGSRDRRMQLSLLLNMRDSSVPIVLSLPRILKP